MNTHTIALSCETTDALDPDGHLIELGAVRVDTRFRGLAAGQGASFHALIQTPQPILPAATAAHGHTQASLAAAGAPWADIAQLWLHHVRNAQLLVWHAAYHIQAIDRALTSIGYAPLHTHLRRIIDLRQVLREDLISPPPRLRDLLTQQALHCPQPANTLQQAQQLGCLWLALGQPS